VILWSKPLTNGFCFQVFLDVVESVNILVNSNGQIIRSDVVGALKMRTYLRFAFILSKRTVEFHAIEIGY